MSNLTCLESYDGGLNPLFTTIQTLTSIAALFGNILVIASVLSFPNLRTAGNLFVVSLAASDLLVAVSIPFYVLFYYNFPWVCDFYPCLTRLCITLCGTVASLLSLVGVAVDRYVAILKPLSHRRLMTYRRSRWIITLGWIYVILFSFLPLMGVNIWGEYDEIRCDIYYVFPIRYVIGGIVSHVLVAFVVTLVVYLKIFRVACKQKRIIVPTSTCFSQQETGTSLMMALVFGVCFLGLLPYLLIIALRYTDLMSQDCWCVVKKTVVCLYFSKSFVNPVIYGWKNKAFRRAFLVILRMRVKGDVNSDVFVVPEARNRV